jgi:hypothetical protein
MNELDRLKDFKLKNRSKIYIYGSQRKRFDCFDHVIPQDITWINDLKRSKDSKIR